MSRVVAVAVALAGLAVVALVSGGRVGAGDGDEPAPDTVLQKKGFKRDGDFYVLSREAAFHPKWVEVRRLYAELLDAGARKQEYLDYLRAGRKQLSDMEVRRKLLLNRAARTVSPDQQAAGAAMIDELDRGAASIRREVDLPPNQQVPVNRWIAARDAFVRAITSLQAEREGLDATFKAYALNRDVRSALDALNRAGEGADAGKGKARVALRRSPAYQADLAGLNLLAQTLRTQTIPMSKKGDDLWVDVTFLDKVTRPVVYDDRSPLVVLPEAFAVQVGLLLDGATVVPYRLPDGTIAEARSLTIPTMRVGNLSVASVAAVVLPPGKTDLSPRVGKSFLQRYYQKVDGNPAELSATLVVEQANALGADAAPRTQPGAKAKPRAKAKPKAGRAKKAK